MNFPSFRLSNFLAVPLLCLGISSVHAQNSGNIGHRPEDYKKIIAADTVDSIPRGFKDAEDESMVSVSQGEFSFTKNENGKKPFVGTIGAGPCMIVTFYDSLNGIAGLTHLDACTNVRGTLNRMFYKMEDADTIPYSESSLLKARILAGHIDTTGLGESNDIYIQILDWLEEKQKSVRVMEHDFNDYTEGKSIIMDCRNGLIYDIEKINLNFGQNELLMLESKMLLRCFEKQLEGNSSPDYKYDLKGW